MKRLFLLAACIVLMLTCSVAFSAPKELHLYSIDTNPEQALNSIIAAFEKDNPEYKIVFHGFERARFDEAVRTAVTGDQPIDIIVLDGQFVIAYIRDGLIDAAEKYVPDVRKRYAQGVLDTITHDGKVWAVPWQSSVVSFWMNQDVFKKYNLPQPETWADLKTIANKLKGTDVSALVYPAAQVWWEPMLLFLTLPDFCGNKPLEFTNKTLRGEVKYTDPAYVKALTRIKSLTTDGILMQGATGIDFDAAIQLFVQGKAAMFYMGEWCIPNLKSALADTSIITSHWVPHDPGMKPQPAGGPGFCATVAKNTKQLKGASAFLKYFARDDMAYLEAFGRGASTGNIAADARASKEKNDPLWNSTLPYYKNVVVFYDWLWEPEITKEFQVQIQSMLGGSVTPEQAAANVQQKFEELRKEGRAYYWK
jgi:raffinose/stachyose/melibiose transport system substrate-binding protein